MNFEEFKRRYEEKLLRAGQTIPGPEDGDYQAFQDQMATVYVGVVIYSEIQHEAAEKQRATMAQQVKRELQKKLIIPNNGIIQ